MYNENCQLFAVLIILGGKNYMERLEFIFHNEVLLENEKKMKLDYCLTEKFTEDNPVTPYFGIQITKYIEDDIEIEKVTGISYKKETVLSIINKLIQHEITPVSMVEVLDDMITEGV